MKPFTIHKPAAETFNLKRIIEGIEVTQWLFSGIELIYVDGPVSEEVKLNWDSEKDGILMYFNVSGKSTFKDKNQSFEFLNNQHTTFYCKDGKGQLLFETSSLKTFIIKLPKKTFFDIGSMETPVLKEFNKRISNDGPAALFAQNLSIDFLIQTCISSILNCKYENSLKRIFLFSKVVELLVLQLESFKTGGDVQKTYIKSEYDKERIFYAKEYLLKNIEHPPSLKQLARVAGINEFKLKKGFRELFNQTVYGYLSDTRLEIAKNDLLEKRKTVGQLALELGYSSVQHFSNSFKQKFGVPPSQIR